MQKRVNISIPEDLHDAAKNYCDEKNITFSALLSVLLKKYVVNFIPNPESDDQPSKSAFRRVVLERDQYKCRICGNNSNLAVHHILPVSTHPELRLRMSNGITLCDACHKEAHASCEKHIEITLAEIRCTDGALLSLPASTTPPCLREDGA